MESLPPDMLYVIASHIMEGSTWKTWLMISRKHYNSSLLWSDRKIKYANKTHTLVRLFPDKPWDWLSLSCCTHVGTDIFLKNMHNIDYHFFSKRETLDFAIVKYYPDQTYRWDWSALSAHSCLTTQFINDNIDNPNTVRVGECPWNYNVLSASHAITLEIVMKHNDRGWTWKLLSQNSAITFENIFNNLHLPWEYKYLSKNKNVSSAPLDKLKVLLSYTLCKGWDWSVLCSKLSWNAFVFVMGIDETHKTMYPIFPNGYHTKLVSLCWMKMTKNKRITCHNILDTLWLPWCMFSLSIRKDLTWDIVLRNVNVCWNWTALTQNRNITIKIIEETTAPWDFWQLSSKKATPAFILNNPTKDWDWIELSYNKNINHVVIERFIDKPWSWNALSFNPHAIPIVEKYPHKPWNWCALSKNTALCWSLVVMHINKEWNWTYLSIHKIISYNIVRDNQQYPWDLCAFSRNPNITLDIVIEDIKRGKNALKWDWGNLSRNGNISWLNIKNNLDLPWEWDKISRCELCYT